MLGKSSTPSVYFKARHMDELTYDNMLILDKQITNNFLKEISSSYDITKLETEAGIDDVIDSLYPIECKPYHIDYNINGIVGQENNLEIIKNVLRFYQQLQLRFNYISHNKCTSPIVLNNFLENYNTLNSINQDVFKFNQDLYSSCRTLSNENYINGKDAHDLYVYIHSSMFGKSVYFIKLFNICLKLQKYINKNYKIRNCCSKNN